MRKLRKPYNPDGPPNDGCEWHPIDREAEKRKMEQDRVAFEKFCDEAFGLPLQEDDDG